MTTSEVVTVTAHAGDPPDLDVAVMTFEELVEELERTARAMESADLGIERAAELYERAGVLHRAATEKLQSVEQRLRAHVRKLDER